MPTQLPATSPSPGHPPSEASLRLVRLLAELLVDDYADEMERVKNPDNFMEDSKK